jgi:hypothetical protein
MATLSLCSLATVTLLRLTFPGCATLTETKTLEGLEQCYDLARC